MVGGRLVSIDQQRDGVQPCTKGRLDIYLHIYWAYTSTYRHIQAYCGRQIPIRCAAIHAIKDINSFCSILILKIFLSEIMRLLEKGGCDRNLTEISN